MSLYRTWRPKSFADLVGQDAVVRTLTTAIDTGRLAHAYLFSGPRGSGKTSAAKILARCIECVAGPTATPDNTCENCRAILAGSALDVLEIDAASNRGIDEIRALRDAVKFAPATMRMKVYIIDEAHMLTKEGANAFLKTLEEPPPYAVFILATTAPEALPPTILSRCQRYAFRRIPIETMIARMRTIAAAEGIAIDDAALGAIAYRADGGLRDALTMLEQVAAFAGGPVAVETVDAAFGQTGREFARRLLTASLDGDATAALLAIDDASDAGTDMAGLIRGTIAEFRHLLVARINPELLSRDLSGDDASAALERARATPQARLIRGLRLLGDALSAARGSGNARLEIETAVLRFVLQHEDPSLDALAARVAALENGAERPPAPARGAAPGQRGAPPRDALPSGASAADDAPPKTGPVAGDLRPKVAPASDNRQPNASGEGRGFSTGSLANGLTRDGAAGRRDDGARSERVVADASNTRDVRPDGMPAVPDRAAGGALASADAAPVRAGLPEPRGPRPAPASFPPAGDLTLHKIRALWPNVRSRAESAKPSLNVPLSQTNVAAFTGDALTLHLPNRTSADILKSNLPVLRAALDGVLGRPLEIRISVENGRFAAADSAAAADDGPGDLVRYAIERLP